jgi:hypothetical protein
VCQRARLTSVYDRVMEGLQICSLGPSIAGVTAGLSRGSVRAANLPRGSGGRGVTLGATGSKDANMARLRAPHPGFPAHLTAVRQARAMADALGSPAFRRLVSQAAILLVLGMAFLV